MLEPTLDDTFSRIEQFLDKHRAELEVQEIGTLSYVGRGIARVTGLPGVQADELIRFHGSDSLGLVFNLDPGEVGVILLSESEALRAGLEAHRTGRIVDVPVGEALLGRIVDAVGRPRDDRGTIRTAERWPIERPAPAVMDRAPVNRPLQTGLKVVDALIPIGRGQRELILGDRQTGKSAIALDTIINQKDKDVLCIYCAVGQRDSAVAKVMDDLRRHDALAYSIVLVATGNDPAGLQYVAPYAATTMAKYFVEQGRDVLEAISGNRVNYAMNCIGGVNRDITDPDAIFSAVRAFEQELARTLIPIFTGDPTVRARCVGVGVMSREQAVAWGTVGPTARASGVPQDIRRAAPYCVYDLLEFEVPVERTGDVLARIVVRALEMVQSCRLIEQALRQMPIGPIRGPAFVEVPPGEAVVRTEAPRGEVFYYIASDGSDVPLRVKVRTPSFVNMPTVRLMVQGATLADVPLIQASIDPCYACTDR
jgi:hypothetical protein